MNEIAIYQQFANAVLILAKEQEFTVAYPQQTRLYQTLGCFLGPEILESKG
jgi:hypothetical protein